MPEASLTILIFVIFLALVYAFANGINDAANAIATVISTRVLRPNLAIAMGAVLNLGGALTGTAVAKTLGKGIIDPATITQITVISILITASAWVFLATRYGAPVSVSHSLAASIVGAGLATGGFDVLVPGGLNKVLIALALSPIIAFVGGLLLMSLLYRVFQNSTPSRVQGIFGKLQIVSAAFMAYSHGKNDGQNAMGIMAMALAVHYGWSDFDIPLWVILSAALAIGLGTYFGGWRVIRTVGVRITKLQPIHGFAAEASAASVIEVASLMGLPISTTHSISSAIMGVGATRRLSAVRWGVSRNIVFAWVVTYPLCGIGAYLLTRLLNYVF